MARAREEQQSSERQTNSYQMAKVKELSEPVVRAPSEPLQIWQLPAAPPTALRTGGRLWSQWPQALPASQPTQLPSAGSGHSRCSVNEQRGAGAWPTLHLTPTSAAAAGVSGAAAGPPPGSGVSFIIIIKRTDRLGWDQVWGKINQRNTACGVGTQRGVGHAACVWSWVR